jgi:D-proline reductase (dithiol) PrdB
MFALNWQHDSLRIFTLLCAFWFMARGQQKLDWFAKDDTLRKLADLKLQYRIFMETYRYRQFDWRPGAVLEKPLSQSQIAVVTSAGFYRFDQKPFDVSIRGGDYSFREISVETDLDTLQIGHKSDAFDHSGIESDKNLALPLDRLCEFKAESRIGDVAPSHYSFMGSISAPARLVSVTAPEIAHRVVEDDVDGVFLTPV